MSKLWTDIGNNLSFIGVCLLVIVAFGVAARLVEWKLPQLRKVSAARRVSIIGICSALAAVLHILDFPLPFLAPGFYKLDFSEVPVLLAGFFLGPSATVACEGVKILLKLLLKGTTTAFVGDFANFVVGCCFVFPAVVSESSLIGTAPELIRNYIELRGIGIVNVAKLFGMGSVRTENEINLVVNIVPWNTQQAYDRLGLEDQYMDILGVKIPMNTIPVTAGRNLAVILEVAAMNNRQRKLGYNAAQEFSEQIDRHFELNAGK